MVSSHPGSRGHGTELLAWASIAFLAVLFFNIEHSLGYSASRVAVASGSYGVDARLNAVSQGHLGRRVDFLLLGVFAAVNLLRPRLFAVRWRTFGILSAGAFMFWACASVLWATAPAISARRLFGLLVTVFLIYSLCTRWPGRDILRLFFVMTLGYLIVGVGAELRNGTFLMDSGYRFSGTLFPGHQGAQCGILLLALVWLAGERRSGRIAVVLCGVIVFGFLLLTKARTSVASAFLGIFFLWFIQDRLGSLSFAMLGGVAAVASGALLALNGYFPGAVSVLTLGRGPEDAGTLTGRVPLWQALLEQVQERPLIGYGYNGYMEGDRALRIANEVGAWSFGGAHNAYLSVVLNLGLVGLALFVTVIVFHLARVALRRSEMQGLHVLFATVLFFHSVRGMMDASWVDPRPNFLGWFALGYLVFVPPPVLPSQEPPLTPASRSRLPSEVPRGGR